MNLENTKVYTKDPEVIRKYADLCGKKFEREITFGIGVYNCHSYKINDFMPDSPVDFGKGFKEITPDQINALHAEKFGKVETPEEAEAFDIMAQDNKKLQNYDVSVLRPVIDVDGKLYTADDVRDLLPKAKPTKDTEWDGEGLPPVGAKCQYSDGVKWHNVKIKYSSDWVVVIECLDEGILSSLSTKGVEISMPWNKATELQFRKLETSQQREEREREEWAQNVIGEMMYATGLDFTQDGDLQVVKAMYDLNYRKQKDGE